MSNGNKDSTQGTEMGAADRTGHAGKSGHEDTQIRAIGSSQQNGDREPDESRSSATPDQGSGDGPNLPVPRRSVLASVASATAAGAASVASEFITPVRAEDDDGGGTSATVEFDVLLDANINDPRIVQAVTNTRVYSLEKNEITHRESDPKELVVDKPASVAFDLEAPDLDDEDIPDVEKFSDETFEITVKQGGQKETYTLTVPAWAVREMLLDQGIVSNETADLATVSTDAFRTYAERSEDYSGTLASVDLPAFTVESNLQKVEVEHNSGKDSLITAGPVSILPREPEHMPKLRIALVGIRQPEGDTNVEVDIGTGTGTGGDDDDGRVRFTATKDAARDIEEVAKATREYLKKAYPTHEVEVIVYHKQVSHDSGTPSAQIDAKHAKEGLWEAALTDRLTQSNPDVTIFPQDVEGPITYLDEVVVLAHHTYFDVVEDKPGGKGVHYGTEGHHPFAASLVEMGAPPSADAPEEFTVPVSMDAEVVAHELTHHYLLDIVYDGSPLISREQGTSGSHAAPTADKDVTHIVLSEGYRYKPDQDGFDVLRRPSLMNYHEPNWPDSLMYKELIDGKFVPKTREESPQILNDGEDILEEYFGGAVSTKGDDGIEVSGMLQNGVSLSTHDTDGVSDDHLLELKVIGMEGDVLDSQTVPTETTAISSERDADESDPSGSETVSGVAPFSLPFPDEAIELEITYQDTTVTAQPLALTFQKLARLLPPEAFEDDDGLAALSTGGSEAEREALYRAAQRMGQALDQDAYSAAAEILDSEIKPIVENVDYEEPDAMNVPSNEELQNRLDTTGERVRTLAAELEDSEITTEDFGGELGGGGGSVTTERTSLHDKDGGPC